MCTLPRLKGHCSPTSRWRPAATVKAFASLARSMCGRRLFTPFGRGGRAESQLGYTTPRRGGRYDRCHASSQHCSARGVQHRPGSLLTKRSAGSCVTTMRRFANGPSDRAHPSSRWSRKAMESIALPSRTSVAEVLARVRRRIAVGCREQLHR